MKTIKKISFTIILFFLFTGLTESDLLASSPAAINISLAAPAGQGQYVHNGNIMTFTGSAPSKSILISAQLLDNHNHVIRDVSKGLKIDPNTGDISGSIFVGSFREALLVHLDILVQTRPGNKTKKGISNKLTVDNRRPEIQITRPKNHSYFKKAPITIQGTASDNQSGIAYVGISIDGGFTYRTVHSFKNGKWQYDFMPATSDTEYSIKAKSTDIAGLETVSDKLKIHYILPRPPVKKTVAPKKNPIKTGKKATSVVFYTNEYKSPNNDGICTYRIIDLKRSRFQPTDLFTLNEEMAIIVKGYGGNMVTIKIIASASEKVVYELTDYIPVKKEKMWQWKLSQTGAFMAELIVNGKQKDDVFFKIIK